MEIEIEYNKGYSLRYSLKPRGNKKGYSKIIHIQSLTNK